MRAIAACQFTLGQFTVWRLFVLALTISAVLAILGWSLGRPDGWDWPIAATAGAVGLAAIVLGARLARVNAASLRWDGHRWHLGMADSAGHEPTAGTLTVAMDLGGWMLLRFRADAPAGWFAATWLPLQRRGLELHWHALRCAVYSPRRVVDAVEADAAADL